MRWQRRHLANLYLIARHLQGLSLTHVSGCCFTRSRSPPTCAVPLPFRALRPAGSSRLHLGAVSGTCQRGSIQLSISTLYTSSFTQPFQYFHLFHSTTRRRRRTFHSRSIVIASWSPVTENRGSSHRHLNFQFVFNSSVQIFRVRRHHHLRGSTS